MLFDRRRSRPLLADLRQHAIDVSLFEFDISPISISAMRPVATARAVWQLGELEVSEEVSSVDHGHIRRTLIRRLRDALCERGGVWMRLSPYPWPYRTAANFRFDHDAYVAEDFATTLRTIRGHEELTTHFVCAATHEQHPEALKALQGLDVGSHGYFHHTYRTTEENVWNLARGIETLAAHGLAPSGFAAPHGRYQPAVAEAMSQLGIRHSSEFAAAYDDLPYDPHGGATLQIPVHPVCLGIALDAARLRHVDSDIAVNAVAEHFERLVDARYAAREPLFCYGHPDGRIGRHPRVLERFLAAVAAKPNVWRTTFTQFAEWWRCRAAVRWQVFGTVQQPELHAEPQAELLQPAVEWIRGESSTLLPLCTGSQVVDASRQNFEKLAPISEFAPLRQEPLGGLRQRVHRFLDWEYSTPVQEIDARHWRGRLKRLLRRWKGATK
ncbi:MAG: polysaccharide deacetylase family protein [Pirellulales bacterium]